MNWVDYTILGILAVFLIYGYSRGFVRQVLGIAGILTGLFLAKRFAPDLAATEFFATARQKNPNLAWMVAFLVIFIAVGAVSGIAISLIWRKLPRREIGGTDTFLGAVLGALQGVLILGGISIALLGWNDPRAEAVKSSVLASKMAEGCKFLVLLIPEKDREELKTEVEEGSEKLRQTFPDKPALPGPLTLPGASPKG
jgi:membrane protein required for colicin V production